MGASFMTGRAGRCFLSCVVGFSLWLFSIACHAGPAFKVIAFYTGKSDLAHISFVREANQVFAKMGETNNFSYESTTNWSNLNREFLAAYQVVLFLDTRPEDAAQREAFQRYMENGGAWMGFHFAGFALTPSAVPENWDWYHNKFICAGQYVSNTWRPTSAVLRVESRNHETTRHLPETFNSAPNEWYRWQFDLRTNANIEILLSVDPFSFPLGNGPKPHEIWHSGYYPVAWRNKNYRMIYVNMGHNDMDYEHKPNKELSSTFSSLEQNQFLLDCLLSLGRGARTNSATTEAKIVAYVPNWIDLNQFCETIHYRKLSHINIAFENPRNDNGELSFKQQDEILIQKAKTNGVRVLISIGGGAASTDKTLKARYFSLINSTNREAFAEKLADYVDQHGFDGLDVDIEGPSINEDFGDFVEALAKRLKPRGKLLTAALSQGYGGKKVPDATLQHFDFVNIMAYDGTGPWEPNSPGPHSSYDFATNNVAYWLGRGLPKSKAVLGVPFYGHGFGEALGKGHYSYARIVREFPGAENSDEAGKTIYYNGIPSIEAKCRFVQEQGLAGIMIWSLDSDVQDERSLLSAINRVLRPEVVTGGSSVR